MKLRIEDDRPALRLLLNAKLGNLLPDTGRAGAALDRVALKGLAGTLAEIRALTGARVVCELETPVDPPARPAILIARLVRRNGAAPDPRNWFCARSAALLELELDGWTYALDDEGGVVWASSQSGLWRAALPAGAWQRP